MQYRVLESSEIDKNIHFSFWQSHIWQNILLKSGQAREVFYFGDTGNILLVEIRSVGLGQYAGFSLGVSSNQLQGDVTLIIQELSSILRDRGCIFYQIEPIDTLDLGEFGASSQFGYKKFLTPHTRLLDISLSEDDILKQMHEKGRYNIRLALKRGVTIQEAQINTETLDIWMALLDETTNRDGFAHNSRVYYEVFLRELASARNGSLLFSYYNHVVIAAMIVVYTPLCAIYYYGASKSDKELRKHMAPYLLQWQAIQESKNRNISLYDFLGVADPNNKNDSLNSVSDFKEKFGGYLHKLPKEVTLPLSWKGSLFLIFRSFFRK